jgi:hypothetical protein
MPLRIVNRDLYHDRTVQDWHRWALPSWAYAMDVDLMGYCGWCARPLYLLEASTNPQHTMRVLNRLADMAHAPAHLVLHDRREPLDATSLRDHLMHLRWLHDYHHHPDLLHLHWRTST